MKNYSAPSENISTKNGAFSSSRVPIRHQFFNWKWKLLKFPLKVRSYFIAFFQLRQLLITSLDKQNSCKPRNFFGKKGKFSSWDFVGVSIHFLPSEESSIDILFLHLAATSSAKSASICVFFLASSRIDLCCCSSLVALGRCWGRLQKLEACYPFIIPDLKASVSISTQTIWVNAHTCESRCLNIRNSA